MVARVAAALPQVEEAVAWVAEVPPQAVAAEVWVAEEPPQEAAAEVSGEVAAPWQEAVPRAARPSEGLRAADLSALLSWVCRRDQVLPSPAPSPAVKFAHAMGSLRIASL